MVLPFFVFWILLVWSLYDGDLYPKEGVIFAGIWLALLLGFYLLKVPSIWFVVPTVLLDIVLIFKIFGTDIQIH